MIFLRNMIWRERRAYRWSQKWGGGNNRRTQTKKRVTWLEQRTNNRSHKNHTVAEYYTYFYSNRGRGGSKNIANRNSRAKWLVLHFWNDNKKYALTMKCCKGKYLAIYVLGTGFFHQTYIRYFIYLKSSFYQPPRSG